MTTHPLIKLSKKEALLYAAVCDMYAEEEENTQLDIDDKTGELFVRCKKGVFTIWHGRERVEEWMKECRLI